MEILNEVKAMSLMVFQTQQSGFLKNYQYLVRPKAPTVFPKKVAYTALT